MLAAWAGLPTGFCAFILVCYFTSLFVSSGVPLLAGAIAGISVWYCFKRLDDRRLEAVLSPPPEVWPVPLAVAWGVLKAAFDGPVVMPGPVAGLLPWRLIKQDQAAGVLVAYLDTGQMAHGSDSSNLQVTVTACLTQHPVGGTAVKIAYTATERNILTEKLLRLTQRILDGMIDQSFPLDD